jgi:hypothetical protein
VGVLDLTILSRRELTLKGATVAGVSAMGGTLPKGAIKSSLSSSSLSLPLSSERPVLLDEEELEEEPFVIGISASC